MILNKQQTQRKISFVWNLHKVRSYSQLLSFKGAMNQKVFGTLWLCCLLFVFVAPMTDSIVVFRKNDDPEGKVNDTVFKGTILVAPVNQKPCPKSGQVRDTRGKCRKKSSF